MVLLTVTALLENRLGEASRVLAAVADQVADSAEVVAEDSVAAAEADSAAEVAVAEAMRAQAWAQAAVMPPPSSAIAPDEAGSRSKGRLSTPSGIPPSTRNLFH
jgi:hypothetical protein